MLFPLQNISLNNTKSNHLYFQKQIFFFFFSQILLPLFGNQITIINPIISNLLPFQPCKKNKKNTVPLYQNITIRTTRSQMYLQHCEQDIVTFSKRIRNLLHSHRQQGDCDHDQIQDVEGVAAEGALVHKRTIHSHLWVKQVC